MKRIKLTVAYDGTNYHGWQVQPNGITIEGVLNQALTDLTREPVTEMWRYLIPTQKYRRKKSAMP